MEIIIRASGERTENECIRLAKQQGNVHIIRAYPFGEAIRQTYKLALTFNQKWTLVIDADVLLYSDVLKAGISELEKNKNKNIFCLDGRTKDKIMMKKRRAGIHIYRTAYLEQALKYIDDKKVKPESNVRKRMAAKGFPTFSPKLIFGLHDYEQYYRDLWRKAVCQTQKLSKTAKARKNKWKKFSNKDKDYFVIYHAYHHGRNLNEKVFIDARKTYEAEERLKQLGIEEKKPYEK
jgi:hypothetical protein